MIHHKKIKQFLMIFVGILLAWAGTEQFIGLLDWGNQELLGMGVPEAVTAALGSLVSILLFAAANWYREERLTDGGRLTASANSDRF